jgi:SAM-dependent methyltransferase
MTGETPRDAPLEASPGPTPSPSSEAPPAQAADQSADEAAGTPPTPPPAVRPSSRKAIGRTSSVPPNALEGASAPTATLPQGNPIPPPGLLPRVPGIDALLNAEALGALRRSSRRIVNAGGDVGAAKTAIPDGSTPENREAVVHIKSEGQGIVRVRSFADDDDEVTLPTYQRPRRISDRPPVAGGAEAPAAANAPVESLAAASAPARSPAAEPPPDGPDKESDADADGTSGGFLALAPPIGSPFMLTGGSSPAPAPRSGPVTPPWPDEPPEATQSAPTEDVEVIRPMRIISIGSTANAVEVSARTSSLPPDGDLSPRTASTPPRPVREGSAPSIAPDDDALELDAIVVVEEDEPVTQPSDQAMAAGRAEEVEPLEEIDFDRITVVDPIEPLSYASSPLAAPPHQKKPPPPPPPKRSPGDGGPNSRPSPAREVASFTAAPASPPSNPGAGTPATPDKPGTPSDPTRKRQRAWWEELFGDDFTRTMDHFEPKVIRKECDFIEDRLGLEKGAVMLDLACGPGSHAVELASRGYSVVGYDLSLAMLARAADEAQERGQQLNFLHGDMREMAFEETFDGVYCWSTSFGYFDDEKNLNVLSRVRRALRKGGMLLLDVTNRDYVAPRQPSLVWFEGDGCVCMDEMHVDFFSSRLRVKRTVMFEDGRSKEVDYSIRLYTLHELGKMLHECGFKVVEVTGHPAHPGVFFGSESPRIIILAERD